MADRGVTQLEQVLHDILDALPFVGINTGVLVRHLCVTCCDWKPWRQCHWAGGNVTDADDDETVNGEISKAVCGPLEFGGVGVADLNQCHGVPALLGLVDYPGCHERFSGALHLLRHNPDCLVFTTSKRACRGIWGVIELLHCLAHTRFCIACDLG